MTTGNLYYEAIGESQMAAVALRPQLYYIWALIKSNNKISRVDLEKLLRASDITQGADFRNFLDHSISILKKKKWVLKSRVVIQGE